LEERLRSRFEWGLITDISPPDLETRIAILSKKAKAEGLNDITNDVLLYIANQINTNIRELEGALIRVIVYSSLINSDINVQLATLAVEDIILNDITIEITVTDIAVFLCNEYDIVVVLLLSKTLPVSIALPSQFDIYSARQKPYLSMSKYE